MEATTFSQFFFNGNFLAVLGAALAVGLGGIGSAKGVGIAGRLFLVHRVSTASWSASWLCSTADSSAAMLL